MKKIALSKKVRDLEKRVAELEEKLQKQPQKLTLNVESLKANLPPYLKDLDIREGSFTHDLIKVIISSFE